MDFRVGLVVFLCLLGLANGTRFHDCRKWSNLEKSLTTGLVVLNCVRKRFVKSFFLSTIFAKNELINLCQPA